MIIGIALAVDLSQKAYTSTIYTKSDVENLLIGKATSSDITSEIAGEADTTTSYTQNNVNNFLQQNKDGSFQLFNFTEEGNVYPGGVISHPTNLIF